ncbi:hypothetical protein AKJ61_04390 [candidate division MSBL1 archaeon SCGC-AAA259B11]|uniref:Uncharacterized protein n=1 Tax=candidate division MSBL1 archaeon SCGC-AAA259B11 TaxID=1698260 RepID=A0A133U3D3_9EURY|nr:hypothetical protein AKJ61_04390 [candidate division MSBL1 archaeon SCGC-AAA259B11]
MEDRIRIVDNRDSDPHRLRSIPVRVNFNRMVLANIYLIHHSRYYNAISFSSARQTQIHPAGRKILINKLETARCGPILSFQRVKLAIMITNPTTMVIIAFVFVVPPGMFISLAKLGLKNEATPIIKTIIPTIKAGVLAIKIPPYLVIAYKSNIFSKKKSIRLGNILDKGCS